VQTGLDEVEIETTTRSPTEGVIKIEALLINESGRFFIGGADWDFEPQEANDENLF